MPDDNDVRRQKLATAFKWALGLAGAFLVAPYIFIAVKGMIGLALAAAVGLIITQLAPVFSLVLANLRMKLLIGEVQENPIETLLNLKAEKNAELEAADQKIVDFETEIGNFDDQLQDFSSQYPKEAPTYKTLSERMHVALTGMKQEQSNARRDLQELDRKIAKAQAIYKMSLAAERVTKLSSSAQARVFAQIKEQVAFDAVRTELNRSFASLNLAIERRADASKLDLPSPTGDQQSITVHSLPVPRKAESQ